MSGDTSKESGLWDDASTWNTHTVPDAGTPATIANGDFVTLTGAGVAASVTVKSGATLDLSGATLNAAGGFVDNGLVIGTGVIGVGTAITGGGAIAANGGTLEIDGSVDATGAATTFVIGAGADLKFGGSVGNFDGVDPQIDFTGNGTLDLTSEGRGSGGELFAFHGVVDNFAAGDSIKVLGPADTVHFDAASDVLTITSGHNVEAQIQLAGKYTAGSFSMSESSGVTTITTSAICFMAGTRIRTPDGETAVEDLKPGDLVLAADGLARPVVWLGRQTISTVFADPLRVWPVRIKAGALADNVPARDLLLSPDHAVLVEGALIHAGALVNGVSILRETVVPKVFTYYHVELDDHALVLAENTPAESFIDNVDRLGFDNWSEHQALYPEGKTIEELPYPRAKAHRQVPVGLRVKLAERARTIGGPAAAVA
jgi:hypothetical protein